MAIFTVQSVTELADGNGFNAVATSEDGLALILTTPDRRYDDGAVLSVDVAEPPVS